MTLEMQASENHAAQQQNALFPPLSEFDSKGSEDNFNIFDDYDDHQITKGTVFYTRPGQGQALYSDTLPIKLAAKEVNRLLGTAPLVEQMRMEYRGPWIEIHYAS